MAKRFRFRLQSLLEIRRRHENEQRRVVGERTRELLRCRDRLAELRTSVTETIADARRERTQASLDVATTMQEQRYRLHLHRRVGAMINQIQETETTLGTERAELARRTKDRKAIEKLRERRSTEHKTNEDRRERAEADEIASQMYLRRPMETAWTCGVGG